MTGLRTLADLLPIARDVAALVGVHIGVAGHGGNVGAGGEGFFAAGDDHAADAFIRIESLQGVTQLVHQLIVERIQGFRAIEADQSDLALPFDQYVFILHGNLRWK